MILFLFDAGGKNTKIIFLILTELKKHVQKTQNIMSELHFFSYIFIIF